MRLVTRHAVESAVPRVTLGQKNPLALLPMALGGSWYATAVEDAALTGAMEAAFAGGIRHFDTAAGYGEGRSETLIGRFLKGRRDKVFLASKSNPSETSAAAIRAEVEASLKRLGTETIDLYYIHWPRSGRDLRPLMEGLEQARSEGKIGAIGVSNFSVAEMEQIREVGRLDAHQLGLNLVWRHAERELIPYCRAHGIAVLAYSALAHGILTGKYGLVPDIAPGDQRHTILPFRPDIWPHVHVGVEKLKRLAAQLGLPLSSLAIRWILSRPGVHSVVVGARDAEQASANLAALAAPVPPGALAALTAISNEIAAHVPDVGNLFDYYP